MENWPLFTTQPGMRPMTVSAYWLRKVEQVGVAEKRRLNLDRIR